MVKGADPSKRNNGGVLAREFTRHRHKSVTIQPKGLV